MCDKDSKDSASSFYHGFSSRNASRGRRRVTRDSDATVTPDQDRKHTSVDIKLEDLEYGRSPAYDEPTPNSATALTVRSIVIMEYMLSTSLRKRFRIPFLENLLSMTGFPLKMRIIFMTTITTQILMKMLFESVSIPKFYTSFAQSFGMLE